MKREAFENKSITDVDIYAFELPEPQQEIVQQLRAFLAQPRMRH